MNFAEAAEFYLALGWPVFPIAVGGKEPLISSRDGGRGFKDATLDREKIDAWAKLAPNANIAIACGKQAGVLVLDIDTKPDANGMASLRALQKAGKHFPPTVMARTPSGGWHAYFRYTPGPNNSKSRLGKFLDIRTEGGYVVVPPSYSAKHQREYAWVRGPIGPNLPAFPNWAVQVLQPREETPFYYERTGDPGDMTPLVNKILELGNGERNGILYWAACRGAEMVKRGEVSPSTVAMELQSASMSKGLSAKEADKTIQSAFNKIFGGVR